MTWRSVVYDTKQCTTDDNSVGREMRINNELIRRCSSKHLLPLQNSEEDHLERITHLYLQEQHIRIIENLDYCRNLLALYLYDNNIETIENLDPLSCLSCLYLHKNSISRIENLDALSQLTVLNLGHNSISKVEGMESLCELRELYIQYQTLPEDQSLEFDPATVTWLGGSLRVLNVSGNKLQDFSMLKPLEYLESFVAEENNVEDLNELVRVVSKWNYIQVMKLTGNPVCNARKYRDNMVVMCLELEELDGKVVPAPYRNFLLNWRQCQRLQDRKKESYAVLKPFLETQRYVSEQVANIPNTVHKWVKEQLTSTWESVRSNCKSACDSATTAIQSIPNSLNCPKRSSCFAHCASCDSQYYVCPPGVGNGPNGDTAPLQSTAGYWLYVRSPGDTLKNVMVQNNCSRYSAEKALNSTSGRSGVGKQKTKSAEIKNKQLSPPRSARSCSVAPGAGRSGSVSSSQSETSASSKSRSKSVQRSSSRTRSLQEVPMKLVRKITKNR